MNEGKEMKCETSNVESQSHSSHDESLKIVGLIEKENLKYENDPFIASDANEPMFPLPSNTKSSFYSE